MLFGLPEKGNVFTQEDGQNMGPAWSLINACVYSKKVGDFRWILIFVDFTHYFDIHVMVHRDIFL
jgi:hypothetical protein